MLRIARSSRRWLQRASAPHTRTQSYLSRSTATRSASARALSMPAGPSAHVPFRTLSSSPCTARSLAAPVRSQWMRNFAPRTGATLARGMPSLQQPSAAIIGARMEGMFGAQRWMNTEAKQEEAKEDAQAASPAGASSEGEAEGAQAEAGNSEVEELKTKLEAKEAEAKELHTKLLRSLADIENVRRRAQDDVSKAQQYAVTGFAKSMLEVADNLGLAMNSIPEELRNDADSHMKAMFEGLELTERVLLGVFKQHGIEKYDSLGEPFDPHKHDALFQIEHADIEVGRVGQVLKEGYTINDRILRPAQVGTVRGAPQVPKSDESSE